MTTISNAYDNGYEAALEGIPSKDDKKRPTDKWGSRDYNRGYADGHIERVRRANVEWNSVPRIVWAGMYDD
jgi:hypothetical protein